MICKNCNQTISDNAKFCNKCGQKAEDVAPQNTTEQSVTATGNQVCPTCGMAYPANIKFCKKDGTHLKDMTEKEMIATHKEIGGKPTDAPKSVHPSLISIPAPILPEPSTKKEEKADKTTIVSTQLVQPQEKKTSYKGVITAAVAIVIVGVSAASYFLVYKKSDNAKEQKAQQEATVQIPKPEVSPAVPAVEKQSAPSVAEQANQPAEEVKPEKRKHLASLTKKERPAPPNGIGDNIIDTVNKINGELARSGLGESAKAREKDGSIIIKGAVHSPDEKEKVLGIVKHYTRNFKDALFIFQPN